MNIVLHHVIYHFLDYSARGEENASQIVGRGGCLRLAPETSSVGVC
jgi:hypothetical protein